MLKGMNEQVRKHREILEGLVEERVEIDRELEWLADTEHPDYGKTGFPNVVASLRLGKRKARLVEAVEERQRILDGKIERREKWLAEKRLVASERAKKVRSRVGELVGSERAEIGLGEAGIWSYGDGESSVAERLRELAREAERKYKALVVMKELAVMVADVFEGFDELQEADLELVEEILGAFEEG